MVAIAVFTAAFLSAAWINAFTIEAILARVRSFAIADATAESTACTWHLAASASSTPFSASHAVRSSSISAAMRVHSCSSCEKRA